MQDNNDDIFTPNSTREKDQISTDKQRDKRCIPTRISITLLCFMCIVELYLTRSNMSIAIVAMVQTVSPTGANSEVPREPFCLRNSTNSKYFNGTFDENQNDFLNSSEKFEETYSAPKIKMTTTERGNLLSAFFYVYGFSGILGGRLGEIYGTKIVFGSALLVDTIGNILVPIAFKTNYWLVIFIRATMGFFQGMCYPSLHSLLPKWIPPSEQTRFVGFVYQGSNIGTAVTLALSGIIISSLGWESSFYISGSYSLLCLILWTTFMYNDPDSHPRISKREKSYIERSARGVNKKNKPAKVPIRKILGSLPLWATSIAHCGSMFGFSFMLTQLPLYLASVIGLNIRNNGLLSSLPFLGRYFGSNFFSWSTHYLSTKISWTQKTWKRINTFISFAGPGIAVVLVGFVGCNSLAALSLFIFAMVCNGATAAGYLCSHLDNTPNFSGTAQGISTSIAFFYSMIGPVVTGALTPEETLDEWIVVYWLVFANYIISGGFFCLFISTDIQPWNDDVTLVSEDRENENEVILKLNMSSDNVDDVVLKSNTSFDNVDDVILNSRSTSDIEVKCTSKE